MNLRTLEAMAVRDVVRGTKLVLALERVSHDGARLVLTRYGMPVAAVVPLDDLQRLASADGEQVGGSRRTNPNGAEPARKANRK